MTVKTKNSNLLLWLIVFCFLMGGEAKAANAGWDVSSLIYMVVLLVKCVFDLVQQHLAAK